MAEPDSGSGGNSCGDDGARSSHEAELSRAPIVNQAVERGTSGINAGVSSGGDGHGGHAQEAGGEGDGRTLEEEGRTLVGLDIGGPRVHRLDFQSGVGGLVVSGVGSAGAGGSSSGGVDGEGRPGLPPRDSERGKDPVVEEEVLRAVHTERVEFIPPEGSSGHEPIMSSDLAEFVGEASLA